MTPKEKAKELAITFFHLIGGRNIIQDEFEWNRAKQCALISVLEFIPPDEYGYIPEFWNEVKTEIEKL